MQEDIKDDGGLGCLGIPADKNNRSFKCLEITQQRLLNTSFFVIDAIEDVTTKYGPGRMIVKIKTRLEDQESDARKFFTNSKDIKYILTQVKKMNKFPRRVTLRANGNQYFLE